VRIEAVTASSFGPFAGDSLRCAPGMTVIYGPNESGKSSWHAALYAGLCGLRRARGGARKEDQEFAERHKPWDRNGWTVAARILLDDGRRIELQHDLDGLVDCRARDADLGRDVSGEILHDGSPDAARWLGLDRRSFLAIACVRQADILAVLEDPALLQIHLQRAAATAGTETTAAAALSRIEGFAREHVGQDRANATKPLRQARERLEAARADLEVATREHLEFVQLAVQADQLAVAAAAATQRARLVRAARATKEAAAWCRRRTRAQELAARCPEGAPAALAADESIAREVAAAVRAWDARPNVPALHGETAAALRTTITELPPMPHGDLEPHADVIAAFPVYERARQALELYEQERPPQPESPYSAGLFEEDLRNLAQSIDTPMPRVDPALHDRVLRAKAQVDGLPTSRGNRVVIMIGALVAAAGVATVALGPLVPGLLVVVAGLIAVMWAATRSDDQARLGILAELHAAQAALAEQERAAAEAAARRTAAIEQATARGLPAEAAMLRRRADEMAETNRVKRDYERWETRHARLAEAMAAAEHGLAAALSGRSVATGESVSAALALYLAACRERAAIAPQAARRAGLQAQLAVREAAELAALEAASRRQQAEDGLCAAATACGISAADDAARADGLRVWLRERPAMLADLERKRAEWNELEALLEGATLDELDAKAAHWTAEAEQLQREVSADDLATVWRETNDADAVEVLQQQADEATQAAARAKGHAEQRGRTVPSVPEAEEAVAAAAAELARVQDLENVLELTRQFLERAEARVHRDVARALAETIRPWLPEVTAQRYRDVRVDPESLAVTVCDPAGAWRDARLLSHGTAEQVYLLLRMALAQHLAKAGESCPLVLDDVTVQCDSIRTPAVLRLLHALSRDRQIILFSQEDEVLAWAAANLQEPQDRLERLTGGSASP
jgi:DNA repair protein SbcC/Rad50